jgi:hypothetical protein
VIAGQVVAQAVGKSLTPQIPIVEVGICTVRIVHVAVFLFTVKRRRVVRALITWLNFLDVNLPFRCLFAVGLSRNDGDAPNFFQKIAEDDLRRHPNIFGWI